MTFGPCAIAPFRGHDGAPSTGETRPMQHRIGWILTTALIVGCNAQSPADNGGHAPCIREHRPPTPRPPSASTWPASTRREAGRRLRRIRQRRVAQDDGDPGRPRRASAPASTCTRIAEKRNARPDPGRRQGQPGRGHRRAQDRRLLRRVHGRGRRSRSAGWQADRRRPARPSTPSPTPRRCRARSARRCAPTPIRSTRPTSTPNICSACSSRRAWTRPGTHVPYLMQGGLGMPNREYYLLPTRTCRPSATPYQAYIEKMLELRRARRMRQAKAKAIFDAGNEDRQGARQRRRQPATCTRPTIPGRWRDFAEEGAGHRLDGVLRRRRLARPADRASPGSPVRSPSSRRWSASEPLQTWKDYLRFHAHQPRRGPAAEGVRRRGVRLLRHATLQGTPKQTRPLEARASVRPTMRSATRSARSTSKSISRLRPRRRSRTW